MSKVPDYGHYGGVGTWYFYHNDCYLQVLSNPEANEQDCKGIVDRALWIRDQRATFESKQIMTRERQASRIETALMGEGIVPYPEPPVPMTNPEVEVEVGEQIPLFTRSRRAAPHGLE